MNNEIEAWLKSGKYLPLPLRDFHDQKDVFRTIDESIKVNPADLVKRPTWIEAQCYVIDVFLWYMARRGYTLQRTRKRGDFRNLEKDIAVRKQIRDKGFESYLNQGRP